MKALVTGAAGFAGRYLVAALREAGWKVTTLDRHPPADIVGDLGRVRLRGRSFDVVFHLAGFSNPSASRDRPEEAYAANAAAAARLAREVRAGRLVVASSCHVYGEVPRRENPVDETRLPRPRTPYAASKLCGEALARASGKNVVVLRPFNHTGPGQSAAYVCPAIARAVALAETGRGPRIVTVEDLSPRRDFFDVRDMARAYLLAADKGRAGQIYNVASGRGIAIGEIAAVLARAARVPVRVRGRRGPESVLVGDASEFRRATGWTPRIPLERTLRDLLEYERAIATP